MTDIQEFEGYSPTWCPGCGDWGIGASLKRAFVGLGYKPSDVMVVFGIGCSGNMNDFLNAYALHSLHGRSLPNAIGIKFAQHKQPVIAIVGDGDCYGEGGNHFTHACRGNHDITVVVHDNSVYGLTTGQVAPTANKGNKSKSTPEGIIEMPLNPLTLSISQGATFVGQTFAGRVPHLIELLKQGIQHKGFSLVNVLQPCVTFNKYNTYEYYRDKTYDLPQEWDPTNYEAALLKAAEPTHIEKFPLGVIYQVQRPTFTDELHQLKDEQLIDHKRFTDFGKLTHAFE
jgi:2-oxoglutarate ferredoxin oxidoreductase subunit beta